MTNVLLAGLGGFVGAALRYLAGEAAARWIAEQAFLWATLGVNVIGCFAIGLVAGVMDARGGVSPELRVFLVVGVLGGFTTYSAFGLEVVNLTRQARLGAAFLHVGLHLVVGFAAVWIGWMLVRNA